MKKNYNPPKFSMETANLIRARYQEGDSIKSLCKRYSTSPRVVKLILKGETYNKWGEHPNLMETKTQKLFWKKLVQDFFMSNLFRILVE